MKTLLSLVFACVAATSAAYTIQPDIEYGTAGGESLLLDVGMPDGPGPFPAIILVHGGTWIRGDKNGGEPGEPGNNYMVHLHEPLARAGFVWISINYRLAPKHRYPACIEDTETAIRWVKANAARFKIDPSRIAISGESAGAQIVAQAIVRADETTRIAGVVLFYGPYDLSRGLKPDALLPPHLASLFGRQVYSTATAALIRDASPLFGIKPGLPPHLLLHGTADDRVPIEQSMAFAERLEAAGVPCEFAKIQDGVHGLRNWNGLTPDYRDVVIAWLRKTLASTHSAAPEDCSVSHRAQPSAASL